NDLITFSEKQDSRNNQYSFGMTQGPSGKYYIIAQRSTGNASFEIWSSDDGINFKKTVSKHELKMEDGSTVAFGKMSISNTRCNGEMDGIVPIVINGVYKYDDGGVQREKNCYYYIVLELP
ncbi:MAG: hypothetical protein IKZ03_06465, partial [Clostridia bacterium]|nr:hypothetical protein [Clostridia bacterium]